MEQFKWQQDFLSDTSKRRIINGGRQTGRTMILKHIALENLKEKGTTVVFVTTSNYAATHFIKPSIKDAILGSGIEIKRERERSLDLENTSVLTFMNRRADFRCLTNSSLCLLIDDAEYNYGRSLFAVQAMAKEVVVTINLSQPPRSKFSSYKQMKWFKRSLGYTTWYNGDHNWSKHYNTSKWELDGGW